MINSCVLAVFSLAVFCCSGNPVIILDEQDSDSFRTSNSHAGTYTPCLKDAYNGQFVHDWARNKGLASGTFSLDPQKDGCYLVEEYHPGGDDACSRYLPKNAKLQIGYCNNKTEEVSVDQSRNGGQWNIVGKWPFYNGMNGHIKLLNSVQDSCSMDLCFWVADAFRVTWIGDDCKTASLNPMLEAEQEEKEAPQTADGFDAMILAYSAFALGLLFFFSFDAKIPEGFKVMILAYCAVTLGLLSKLTEWSCCVGKGKLDRKDVKKSPVKEASASVEEEAAASMEEGKASDNMKPAEDDESNSTLAPSSEDQSEPDKLSEPSLTGDAEDSTKPVLSIVSDQSI